MTSYLYLLSRCVRRYSSVMMRIVVLCPRIPTLATSTDFEVFLRRTLTREARRPPGCVADSLASSSAALLCALCRCASTHLISTRLPVRDTILISSFQSSALTTGLPSRVIHPDCGQLN